AKSQQIKSGRVLWLRFIRPADEPVAYQQAAVKEKPVKKEPKTSKVVVSSASTLPNNPRTSPVSAPADTVKRQIAEAKPEAPTSETLENASDQNPVKEHVLTEEKEFELDEPVNFVGVDKSKIVANSQKKVHVVQTGETLYSIAQTYNTTVSELQEINALSNSTDLKIGQELIIDPVEKVQENQNENIQSIDNQFIVYQVKPGETLYQIARDHQATIKEVMKWNNKKDFNISVGEELKLLKRP
ncbi:MAG: LysM peptidoglycan-binding domain-containing protein, partial [Cyclobacteriaceae bacterium]|nr:LysM peptidoglycan-binding domain-containing protein [Cyclobacteriaceae bacterium]